VPPAALKLSSDTTDLIRRARTDSHRGTCVTQGQGNGSADTPARPCDERGLPVQANQRKVFRRGHRTSLPPGLAKLPHVPLGVGALSYTGQFNIMAVAD
jgi:hypothetical protein